MELSQTCLLMFVNECDKACALGGTGWIMAHPITQMGGSQCIWRTQSFCAVFFIIYWLYAKGNIISSYISCLKRTNVIIDHINIAAVTDLLELFSISDLGPFSASATYIVCTFDLLEF